MRGWGPGIGRKKVGGGERGKVGVGVEGSEMQS